MDGKESVNDWSSDNEIQICNDSNPDIDPARGSRLPQQSQRRPAQYTSHSCRMQTGTQTNPMIKCHPLYTLYHGMETDIEQKENSEADGT